MKIGMVGLGKMGMNMARRLLSGGHQVVAFNRTAVKTRAIEKAGAQGAASLADAVGKLDPPRVVWLMLPAGEAVDETLDRLEGLLSPGDLVVDGGNSFYRDDIRRARELEAFGVSFVDAGVSGGIWGVKTGYCLMLGGSKESVFFLEPVLRTLASEDGYLHCGPTGAGHFVKMVHNGIEYGMMQAYGEGFEILSRSPYADHLDFSRISHLWNQGSVVRSWLLELAEEAFRKDSRLDGIEAYVEDSGEGRWTVLQAAETAVPAPVITLSLFARFRSREEASFSDKVVAALRREFGGHSVVPAESKGRKKP